MNRHTLAQPGVTKRWAITPPGETVQLGPGCYVASVGLAEASTRRIASVAYGVGALDQQGYADMLTAIDTTVGDDEGAEALDAIQIELVNILNNAAETGVWGFIDGDLLYEPEDWWSE